MKAILYAAGRGSRLGPHAAHRPKVLLKFGGRTLLAWHARRLRALGVREVVVVTGWRRADVRNEIDALRSELRLEMREVYNPCFSEGSVVSFLASLRELHHRRRPLLLMDADVIYPEALLGRLLHGPHPTALLVDRGYSLADDEPVLVPSRSGVPFDLAKRWSGTAEAVGESVGFFKIAPADIPRIVTETLRRAHGPARSEPYEEILRSLVRAGRVGQEDITGLPWTEIDFPHDLERAHAEVWPAIRALEEGGPEGSGAAVG